MDVEAWHRRRLDRLRAPDGWLSLVGLHWLAEGTTTLGSAPDADVVLGAPAPPRLGVLTVRGGRAHLHLEPAAGATIEGDALLDAELAADDAPRPTVVRCGTLSFHLIRRQDRLALRLRDEASPARAAFRGIPRFPVDPSWRLAARLEPDPSRPVLRMPTIVGIPEDHEHAGVLRFEINGRSLELDAVREPGAADLFLVFGDATNGVETYGGGRFLRTPVPGAGGAVILDFNRAYNPPCVFTPFATCPLPTPENRLPLRVPAGEMLP